MLHSSTQNADSLDAQAPPRAMRHRLPNERASVTHKFAIAGHEGYLTVGLYPNGQPGELFIRMAKEGSTISGLMDSFATAISMCLQHGVPLKLICEKFAHTRFEPSGWTGNEEIGYAKSIMDYLFRWMQLRFLSGHQLDLFAGLHPTTTVPVTGHITAPHNTVITTNDLSSRSAAEGSASPAAAPIPEPHTMLGDAFESNAHNDRTPPQQGIAPRDLQAPQLRPRQLVIPQPTTDRPASILGGRRPQLRPRLRRHEGPLRHGRRPQLQHLRQPNDPQRLLLPLHGMRLHQRLLISYFQTNKDGPPIGGRSLVKGSKQVTDEVKASQT